MTDQHHSNLSLKDTLIFVRNTLEGEKDSDVCVTPKNTKTMFSDYCTVPKNTKEVFTQKGKEALGSYPCIDVSHAVMLEQCKIDILKCIYEILIDIRESNKQRKKEHQPVGCKK
jgi:hypothetical protein